MMQVKKKNHNVIQYNKNLHQINEIYIKLKSFPYFNYPAI